MIDFLKNLGADFWATLAEMSPYLLFGFLVAGLLSVFISPQLVRRHLGGKGLWPLLKASAFGVPLPLCSCGVIPVSMSLRKSGAGKGSTIAFLLSTPQTGVDSILVTYSLMGPIFMIVRPLVALITGLIGGGLVELVDRDRQQVESVDQDSDEDSNSESSPRIVRIFHHGFVTLPRDIGKAMLIGLVLAALIGAAVPDDFFTDVLGTGLLAMLAMMIVGIPVYVCATASVPVAVALIAKGVGPGAALVFLMTGPATNAAGFMTIWSTLGPRTAIVYLITVAGCALGAGLAMDLVFPDLGLAVQSHWHQMATPWWGHVSAIVLLGVLGYAILGKRLVNNIIA
ncbi:MAG: permease [Sedimentisphaerales bacterium]|nr:permease [Sedimentisphaerales bacterium]